MVSTESRPVDTVRCAFGRPATVTPHIERAAPRLDLLLRLLLAVPLVWAAYSQVVSLKTSLHVSVSGVPMAWAASPVFHVLSLLIAAALVLVPRGKPARLLSLVVLCGGAVLTAVWVGLLVTTGSRPSLVTGTTPGVSHVILRYSGATLMVALYTAVLGLSLGIGHEHPGADAPRKRDGAIAGRSIAD